MAARKMHMMLFTFPPYADHYPELWRHPQNMGGGVYDELGPEVWMHEARVLDGMLFDGYFVGDGCGLYAMDHDSIESSLLHGSQSVQHFAALFAQMQAMAAPTLGVVTTLLTMEHHPFTTARLLQTMDHLTKGRVGWNVVTGINPVTMQHLGKELVEHDLRYEMADEYLDLCYRLWESWDEGAMILDRKSGAFADPSKVHELHYEGRWFMCRGPLTLPRSPQTIPVIVQAGQSKAGREFGSKHAEVIFTIHPNLDRLKGFYSGVKTRMVELGRTPEDCAILPGVMPIVGASESEAEDKYARFLEVGTLDAGLAWLAGTSGFDTSKHDLDTPVTTFDERDFQAFSGMKEIANPNPGSLAATPHMRKGPEVELEKMTLRHVGEGYAEGLVPKIVGTAAQVADQLEQIVDENGADGFMVSPAHHPGTMEEFRPVIAELQRRGRYRTEYEGPTLRDRLGTTPYPWSVGGREARIVS